MNSKKLTPEKRGVLKGVLGTSLVFSVGIGIGAFFLHQRHEEELDKLERDTARDCLDFAAEHYERVLRQKKNNGRTASTEPNAEAEIPFEESEAFQHEIGGTINYEATAEEWEMLERKMEQQCEEYERIVHEITAKDAKCREELARLRSKIYAENDLLNREHNANNGAHTQVSTN